MCVDSPGILQVRPWAICIVIASPCTLLPGHGSPLATPVQVRSIALEMVFVELLL